MGTTRRHKGRKANSQSLNDATNNNGSVETEKVFKSEANDNDIHFSESQIKEQSPSHVFTATISAHMGFMLHFNAIWLCGFCYDDHVAIEKNRDVLNTLRNNKMSLFADIWMQTHIHQHGQAADRLLLLDSCSSTNFISNPKLLHNIHTFNHTLTI